MKKGITLVVVLAVVIILAIAGFSIWNSNETVDSNATNSTADNEEASSTNESEQAEPAQSRVRADVDDQGVILRIDGESKRIATNLENSDDPLKNERFQAAQVSSDGKFVAMLVSGWEAATVRIYDIQSEKTYDTNESASGDYEWLSNGKLRLNNEPGIATGDQTFESVSASEPWVLEEIK